MMTSGRVLRVLSPDECLELLAPGGVGRVGFASAEGVVMLPVNFAVTGGHVIVFRTAPDTVLAVHATMYATAPVSFEADQADEESHEGWSVLVQGHAHEVTDEREVTHLERATGLKPWVSGARDVWVRITPARISGRELAVEVSS
jgi:nitroimidazol reductase NimA-like FMN-containing flavoprotein (pyridoxamine 5'-phosphate oxidase superfamily)